MWCLHPYPSRGSASTLPCRARLPLPPQHLLRVDPHPHPHLQVPQTQTTGVKNRASLLVPVSSGTRCSHKHAGW